MSVIPMKQETGECHLWRSVAGLHRISANLCHVANAPFVHIFLYSPDTACLFYDLCESPVLFLYFLGFFSGCCFLNNGKTVLFFLKMKSLPSSSVLTALAKQGL